MKFLPLFLLLFFILLTHAQRRTTTAKSTADPDTPKPISRGRGRSRFVSPSEYSDPPSSTESSSRKTIASRRRVVENIEQKFLSRSSVASSTPKQAISTNANRRTASVVQTADTIFLNNDKVARPSLVENVGRNTPAPSTFRAFNKRPKNSYEVEETPDDIDPYRRKKPRVLTETNFKSSNFPKRALENSEPPSTSAKISKNLLTPDSPSPLSTLGNTNLLEEQLLDTTLKPELETPIGTLTEDEIQEETQKTIPVSSTVKPTEPPRPPGKRRTGVRKVVNRVTEPVIATPAPGGRVRTRNRPTQAPDFYFQSVSTSVPSTSFRRRVDSLFSAIEPRKGPSVFNADTTASESRSRTGRKIDLLPTEKIPSRGRRVTITPTTVKSTQTSTLRSRGGRFRSREMPIIDEQKLEVLPLFEEEPKIVPTRGLSRNENSDSKSKELKNADVTKSRTSNRDERTRHSNRPDADSRSKNKVSFVEKEKPTIIKKENIDLNSRRRGYPADYIEASATETDMKITITAVNVESTTQPPKPSTPSRNTQVKESVTQEINEVTSRRKVSRKKVIKQKVPSFRGTKKSEVKLEKKHSSEEIGESDNYPEEFKALLKAKKEHKESRPSPLVSSSSPSTLSSTISVVTSSTPPSTTAYLLTTRQINDNDNEIKPKPSTPSPKITSTSPRWSRSRYSPSTTTQAVRDDSSTRRQSFRTTTSSTTLSRGTKHFITFPSRANSSVPKLDRNVSFKPRISNSENEIRRFNRGRNAKQPSESNVYSTKVPKYSTTVKKFDRGKYRSGSTTIAPKYIPTIPSVPYVPTVPIVTTPRTWVGASTYTKDDDLGLQVISIDEPVHAIPSANLVNGNYNVPTENSVTIPLPLVNGGTTEKPVSIIERIINSITARSTISPSTDTVTKITASTTESPSAILKLAPKRARQTDKTDDTRQRQNLIDTVSLTTENPTTIIEKILSSLNAIQATDKNGSVQVGTNFNTLSSFTTTPLPSVTKSSTRSLLALSSTSVNPLSILDEITPEEVLQKRTIGRLLDILNGLVISTPLPSSENLVVVTPKSVNKPSTSNYPLSSTFTSTIFNEINSEVPSTISLPSTALSSDSTSSDLFSTTAQSISTSENANAYSTSTNLFSTTAQAISTSENANVSSTDISSLAALTSTDLPTSVAPPFEEQSTVLTTEATSDSVTLTVVTEDVSMSQEQSSTLIPVNDLNLDETLLTSTTTIEPQTVPSTSAFPSTSEVGVKSTDGINFFTSLSTLPTLDKFEVSPGSVSVFSANDLSNSITPDDNFSTTTIINIAGRSNFDNTATTQSTTTEVETTTLEVTTEAALRDNSGAMESSTPVTVNSTQANGRSGKLLNVVEDPVQNSIDTSTPDYFIFAVLNNNTVLRKRPLVEANAPFLVIGVYPNNTVVKKYPNGTEVPMESVIRVRGFDTRQNPPPLPEITSNQVTSESGSSVDNKIVETDEQNTIPSDTNSLSTAASTTTRITSKLYKASSSAQSSTTVTTPSTSTIYSDSKPTSSLPMSTVLITGRTIEPSTVASNVNSAGTTLPDMVTVESSTVYSTTPEGKIDSTFPTLSGLLNGNILEAYNEIVNKTDNKNSDIPKSDGVKVNTYTQVLNIQDLIKNQNEDRVFNRRPILDKVDSVANLTSTLASTTVESSTVETPKIEMSTQDSVLLSNKILDDTTTTIRTTTKPTKGRRFTSTPTIPTSTFFPIFLSTFFPNVFETTKFPIIPTTSPEGVIRISAAPSIDETLSTAASTTRPTTVRLTTARTTTEQTTAIPTTTRMRTTTTRTTTTTRPTTTTKATTTTRATTTVRRRTTTPSTTTSAPTTRRTTTRPRLTTTSPPIVTTTATPITSTYQTVTAASSTKRSATVADFNTIEVTTPKTIKLNELSKEQRENLKIIAQLEKEQAQLLQQLSFLTNLGLGANRGTKPPTNGNRKPNSSSKTLAERIVALAVERDKTTTVEPTIPTTTRLPNSIQDQLAALQTTRQPQKATSLDDVLKQLNLNGLNVATKPTEPTVKSEDAILNSLLREQGIIPPTPKSLAGIFDETPIRSRPRTPAPPPPGPLMRGLNWLLTALGPQPQPQIVPTRRPTRKPAKPTKPKKPPIDQELLANSPTHVTPVVTLAPSKTANALSQDDIKKLISQLEGIQKNPSKGTLDLSQIKSIQNLINLDEGVVVMTNGEHGTTSRRTSTAAPTTIRSRQPSQRQSTQRQPRKLPTEPPPLIVSVSNSVEEFDEFETTTNRVVRAPIGFRPVPGVDDDNPNTLVRSNLITAAVNVTKAISSFLGTALQTVSQGAASSFSSLFGGGSALGSRLLGNAALGSSAG